LEQFGYRPKKRLGQNFLTDAGAAAKIASAVCDGPQTRIVEIGPGTGALTQALLALGADVTAIDVDADMVRILHSRDDLAAARIVHADALGFDYAAFAQDAPWRVTGNLPYNIATPLIMRFVEMHHGPQMLVVMVQNEVARRIAATPSTAEYGSLSVAVQYAMRVERLLTLRPGAFYPRPKIESTVIRLTRLEQPAVRIDDERRFRQVVRAAFAYRRKTLANSISLALGLSRAEVTTAILHADLNPEIRGEQLSLEDFARLADRLRT
jgi:16S rRNA (adenine1518-N6/adenine1519-N6)-dimethyltransferase